jgi:hypothetical protein
LQEGLHKNVFLHYDLVRQFAGLGGGARFYTLAEWEETARACLME